MTPISYPVVISLITIAWSAGVFVGLFTARFVAKKDCEVKNEKLHERIDKIQSLLSGGKIYFELRQVKGVDV